VLAGKAHGGHDIPTIPTELNERRPPVNPSIQTFRALSEPASDGATSLPLVALP
jgi:hypothetical protein